jgi:hypothetical protein
MYRTGIAGSMINVIERGILSHLSPITDNSGILAIAARSTLYLLGTQRFSNKNPNEPVGVFAKV